MATLTVNGASNRAGEQKRGCGSWGRHVKLRQLKARRMQLKRAESEKKNIRKIKSQTKIKVLKVNNANWHFASRQAEEKRLKKTARKKSKKKNVLLQDDDRDDDGGKPSRSPIENDSCSYFSVFGFWISALDLVGNRWAQKWLND